MSRDHSISFSYSGGGPNALRADLVRSGGSDSGYNEDCPTGTTTFAQPLTTNTSGEPAPLSYALLATGGDVTIRLQGDDETGIDIELADGIADIQPYGALASDSGPSLNYLLHVLNANTATVNVEARFLWE